MRPPTKVSTQQLFLPGSSDEGDVDYCDHSATNDPASYHDESCSDTVSNTAVGQDSANDWNTSQPASSQWSRDEANINQTLLGGSVGVTTPHRNARSTTQSTLRRKDSYALSPSRMTGFIRRSQPYVCHSTIRGPTVEPLDLTFKGTKFPGSDVDPKPPVDSGGSEDIPMEDPLAEFDRWLASGAVVIIPDSD